MVRAFARRYGVQVALIGVAALWGGTFVVVADAIARYPMYGFLAWQVRRRSVAFVALYPKVLSAARHGEPAPGLAGVFLAAGYIFQTWGLDGATRTTPARAAFITGLYVVITPLLQALVLRKVPRARRCSARRSHSSRGLWVLSGVGGVGHTWVLGDTLVVVCALADSLHMIVRARRARSTTCGAHARAACGGDGHLRGHLGDQGASRPAEGSQRDRRDPDLRRARLGARVRDPDMGAEQACTGPSGAHLGDGAGVRRADRLERGWIMADREESRSCDDALGMIVLRSRGGALGCGQGRSSLRWRACRSPRACCRAARKRFSASRGGWG